MADQLFTRPMYKGDIPQISAWFARNSHRSSLDESVLSYPSTSVICAYRPNGEATGVLRLGVPVQQVYMLESLAPAPDLTPLEAAQGLRDIVKVVGFEASNKGVREIFFQGSDPVINGLAEHHGFERLSGKLNDKGIQECKCMPLFRLKL